MTTNTGAIDYRQCIFAVGFRGAAAIGRVDWGCGTLAAGYCHDGAKDQAGH